MRVFDLGVLLLLKLNNYITFVKPSEKSEDLGIDENDVFHFVAVLTGTFLLITGILVLRFLPTQNQFPSSLIVPQFSFTIWKTNSQ